MTDVLFQPSYGVCNESPLPLISVKFISILSDKKRRFRG
jgi:hypothetical protein